MIIASVAIPILIVIGYIHTKKSAAYKAEADIGFESNPHMRRMLINTEKILDVQLELSKLILKFSKNEKLTNDEIEGLVAKPFACGTIFIMHFLKFMVPC